MRILHLTTFLQGGAGLVIASMALWQAQAGHTPVVVTSRTGEGDYGNYPDVLRRLRDGGVRVEQIDSLFKRDLAVNMSALGELSERLSGWNPDIVHAHAAVPAMVGMLLARRTGATVVETMHGWGVAKTPAQSATDLAILRQVDHLVALSDAARRDLEARGLGPVTVIPNGIAPRAEDVPAPDDPVVRAWRVRGLTVLICIGSIGERKNQRLLVDAMSASDAPAGVACLFIGEGDGAAALAAQAEASGIGDRVRFLGYVPDASRWLSVADWLVLPSRNEGQPMAVLEAYGAKRPVIASDIPELTEVVRDGRTGLVFESDCVDACVRALRAAVATSPDERLAMGESGWALWHDAHTLDRMMSRYMALYAAPATAGGRAAAARPSGGRPSRVRSTDRPWIACLSNTDWGVLRYRKQHLMERLAASVEVLYVNPPRAVKWKQLGHGPRVRQVGPGIRVFEPPVLPGIRTRPALKQANYAWMADRIRRMAPSGVPMILWVYSPHAEPFIDLLDPASVVYDIADLYATPSGAVVRGPAEQRELDLQARLEARLLRRADDVLCVSEPLARRFARETESLHLVPNGCDWPRYADLDAARPNRERPLVGYVGTLAPRFDVELSAAVAQARPDWDFEFVGPVSPLVDVSSLGRLANVRLRGEVPYDEVPACLRRYDVCVLPLREIDFAYYSSPIQVYDYLGAGRPVVSTPVGQFEQWDGLVRVASGPSAFAEAIEASLEDGPDAEAARRVFARANSWDTRVRRVIDILGERYPALAQPAVVPDGPAHLSR
jgi:L-malate glycosyltransferase